MESQTDRNSSTRGDDVLISVLAFAHETFCSEPKLPAGGKGGRPPVVYENPIEKMNLMTNFFLYHSIVLEDFQEVPVEIISYARNQEDFHFESTETQTHSNLERNIFPTEVRSRSFTPEFFRRLKLTFKRVRVMESSAFFLSLRIGRNLSLKFDPESPEMKPMLDNPGFVSIGLWVGSLEQVMLGSESLQPARGLGKVFRFKTTEREFLISFVTIEGVNFELIHELN